MDTSDLLDFEEFENVTDEDVMQLLDYTAIVSWNVTIATNVKAKKLPPEVVHQLALLSFFMVIALIGNLTVVTHLIRIRGWQRPVTIFVMSLAVSDVCIAIFSMTVEILWEAFGEWIFGNVACKAATYVQCLLFVSTAFILMSMSYDRYEAICKPMTFSRSLARSRMMIIVSWALAFLVALPQIFIFVQVSTEQHPDGAPKYSCKSEGYTSPWQRKIYVTWVAFCVFIVPLFFVAFCYINIAIVVWRTSNPYTCAGTQNGEQVILRRNNSHAARHGIEHTKVKTIKLTICILSCYIICWTPYFTMNLLNVWTDYAYRDSIPSFIRSLSKCLAWFSSCVNPIIYGGFHFSFRPLRKVFCPSTFKGHEQRKGRGSSPFNGGLSSAQPSMRTIRTLSDTTLMMKHRPSRSVVKTPPDSSRQSTVELKVRPGEQDTESVSGLCIGERRKTGNENSTENVWL